MSSTYDYSAATANHSTYLGNLSSVVAAAESSYIGGVLSYVPREGDFNGNRANDAWAKAEALDRTFYGNTMIDYENRGATSEANARAMFADAAAWSSTHGGADPWGLVPDDVSDTAAYEHDLTHWGTIWAQIASNATYAGTQIENGLSTGNFYSWVAAPFIGIAGTVMDLANWLGGSIVSVWNGIVSGWQAFWDGDCLTVDPGGEDLQTA